MDKSQLGEIYCINLCFVICPGVLVEPYVHDYHSSMIFVLLNNAFNLTMGYKHIP